MKLLKITGMAALIQLFISFAFSSVCLAAKVVDFNQGVEVLMSTDSDWTSVKKFQVLKKNHAIRTGSKSFVELIFNKSFDNVLRLSPSSLMRVGQEEPLGLELTYGQLFVLREGNAQGNFGVLTPHGLLEIKPGAGAIIQCTPTWTRVRVFGDGVSFQKTMIKESYKFIFKNSTDPVHLLRMNFADYKEWLFWTKEWYAKKDDYIYDIVEKDFDL